MSDENTSFITKSAIKLNYWKLAIWKACSGCLIVTIGGLVASLTTQEWQDMTTQGKVLLMLGVALSVLKYVEGFLDSTMGNLRVGNLNPPAIPSSVTDNIQKMLDEHFKKVNSLAMISQISQPVTTTTPIATELPKN